ncbi:MAG TPA: histidine kinase [Acidimicrobiales bacterium]|nr:histidine kinase [Acidimicrobiales bacterium]
MAWAERWTRAWAFDVLAAIAVTLIAAAGSVAESRPRVHVTSAELRFIDAHQPNFAYALVVLAGLALIWRRVRPVPTLAVTVGLVTAYAAAGYVPGAALLEVYVALYTVATVESRSTAFTGGAVAAAMIFVATGLGGPFGWLGGTNSVMVVCVVASIAVGIAVNARRQVFVAMKERAERAERDREEEARRRVDAERMRIARELHDVVAHTMSMINIQAGVAAHVLDDKPGQAAEALAAIKDASREGLRELRAILNVLRQADFGDGTAPAPRLGQLPALVDATTQAGVATTLRLDGDPPGGLPEGLELAAYRIVQESLTNVLRHAGPGASASVTVSFQPGRLILEVDDDGQRVLVGPGGAGIAAAPVDMPAATAGTGAGAGIAGMRERAGAFGGTLEAGPRPDGGWRVRAVLEVPAAVAVPGEHA